MCGFIAQLSQLLNVIDESACESKLEESKEEEG